MCGQQSTGNYWKCVLSTCGNEKFGYILSNRMSSFYECKKCKACYHVWNITFKDQKPTNMLFAGDGTHCFAKKASRRYNKQKPSPFFEENSPPITLNQTRT